MNSLKEYINRCFRKSFLFRVLVVLCALLASIVIVNSVLSTQERSRSNWASSVDMIDQRMNSIIYEINNFPRYADNDIVFLSKLSSVQGLNQEKLEQDFLSFMYENTAYYRLAYIDEQGSAQVSVVFDGENYQATKTTRAYLFSEQVFTKTDLLGQGEVYVSHIELSKTSESVLENRGTAQSPRYVPIIVYATPVFSGEGKRIGLIAASVYADYFLDDIRSFGREGEAVFLIDNQGYYLAHPDRRREFASLLGLTGSFQNDYPQVAPQILSGSEKRIVETKDKIFSFRYIYPTKGSFAIFKGAEKINGGANEDYHWIMISVTETKYLQDARSELFQGAIASTALSLLVTGSVVAIGSLLAFRKENKL